MQSVLLASVSEMDSSPTGRDTSKVTGLKMKPMISNAIVNVYLFCADLLSESNMAGSCLWVG
jgi:hypothetical protein